MKCPQCSFVCSELRDICPKCLLDLRPHKQSLSLPISAPNASYKELVESVSQQPKPPKVKKSGLFSKVFGGSTPAENVAKRSGNSSPLEEPIALQADDPEEKFRRPSNLSLTKGTTQTERPLQNLQDEGEGNPPPNKQAVSRDKSVEEFVRKTTSIREEEKHYVEEGENAYLEGEEEIVHEASQSHSEEIASDSNPLPLEVPSLFSSESDSGEPFPLSVSEEGFTSPRETTTSHSATLHLSEPDGEEDEVISFDGEEASITPLDDDDRDSTAFSRTSPEDSFFEEGPPPTKPQVEQTVAELFGVESKPFFPKEFTYTGQLEEPGSFFDENTSQKRQSSFQPKSVEQKDSPSHFSSALNNQNEEGRSISHVESRAQHLQPDEEPTAYYTDSDHTDSAEASEHMGKSVESSSKTSDLSTRTATDVVETSYEFSEVVSSQSTPVTYVQFKNLSETTEDDSSEEMIAEIESEEDDSEEDVELSDDFSFEIPAQVLKSEDNLAAPPSPPESVPGKPETADTTFSGTSDSFDSYEVDIEVEEEDFEIPAMVPKPTMDSPGEMLSRHHEEPPLTETPTARASQPPASASDSSTNSPMREDQLSFSGPHSLGAQSAHIQMLFQQSEEELKVADETGEISLSFDQLAEREHNEMLELYFDLAEEAIADPSNERNFQEEIVTSERRSIDSSLTEKAVEVEKEIAIIRRDKARAARRAERHSTMNRQRLAKEVPARPIGWMRRSACSFIDLTVVAVVCIIAVTVSHLASSSAFAYSIQAMQMPDTIDLIYIFGLFLAVLPLTLVLYQTLLLALFEKTLGMFFFKVEIAQEDGDLPSAAQLVLRGLSFPLSALFLGFIPPLFGRRSLADHFARTILIHQRELL